ncbi:MAG: gliding motility protein GldM [Bacteroidia bacterium]|nr:gliding motility protein GldM [Bacteroidia bacterium]
MAGGKETPRQKMIGMMYLVLTALLALNVSKSILDAFIVVNEGLQKTNKNFVLKNTTTYGAFKSAMEKDPTKTKPYFDRALEVQKICKELNQHITELKKHLVLEIDKPEDPKSIDKLIDSMKYINSKDNYDLPTTIMIGEDLAKIKPKTEKWSALELKEKIDNCRNKLIKLLDDGAGIKIIPDIKNKVQAAVKNGLSTDIKYIEDGHDIGWAGMNFYHLPLVAVLTNLTKMQNDVNNAEADVINGLLSAVKANDFTFDKLTARVIAPSSYIIAGDEYKAEVLLVAFNSSSNPEIVLGSVDTVQNKILSESGKIPVEGGLGRYSSRDGSEGLKKWGGAIKVAKPDGTKEVYTFQSEYMVAKPGITVSPTKMNVLYIGVDNPLSISAPGIANEKVQPSISAGSLSAVNAKNGEYIAKVTAGTKEAIVSVMAEFNGQKKKMGEFKFRVKTVPNPAPFVNGKKEGLITKGEVEAAGAVIAKMENFDFDLNFKVTGFTISVPKGGDYFDYTSTSNRFTPEMLTAIKGMKKGSKLIIENIKAVGPDGTPRKLENVVFKING